MLPAWLLVAALSAGTTHIVLPGREAWHAPLADFEPPQSCDTCAGPRAFAVLDGEPWFLLSDRLVSGSGQRLRLPSAGVDLAAGEGGLWVLCAEHLARLEGDDLRLEQPRWQGTPLELAGDGTVMSDEGIGGEPFAEGRSSPWGAGLRILEESGRWTAAWPDQDPVALPGGTIVDARPVGWLPSGAWVLALTDSRDGSAPDAVRFVAVSPGRAEVVGSGEPNGELGLRPRRFYAVDPVQGRIYTIAEDGDQLSLRRY